jgi:PAS domain S-box-containing protein
VLQEMLAGRKSYYLMSLCAKDGSFISVETRVTVGKWDDADVLFAISHDITERQNAEAALRMQSAAFESFALAIIITDIHGNIQWSNSAFSKLTGYDLDEVLGKRNAEFVKSGLQEDTFYQDMWSTILGGRVWSGELINKRKNGSLYPEELTITPILDFNGKVSGFIAIKIDISNRKKLEESLLQTISKEKELNELKSRFVSMASHEFRTPLSSILMSGETLMAYWKKLDEEQINAKLQNIRDQVQHLGILVTDVMQVSKIQEGKLTIEQQKIDLIAICHDVIYNFDNDELANSINKIELKCDFEILNMFLDNRQIVQALNNLISNAVKYAEPDPIIKIRIWQEGQEILLSVQDNGIGIPEEDQKYLFQPFYRASNARQIQGNGLGLNIVRESMHLHGGEITFVSYPGRGTTFTLHFPKKLVLKP